jgi:hypothetical protein
MKEHSDDFVEDNPMAAPLQPRGDVWEQTKQRASRARERTEIFVRENPVPLIIGALGLGVAIGLAIGFSSEEREERGERTMPIDRFNWSFLSLPFLWPLFKSVKEKYSDSADAVKENVDRLKNIDLDHFSRPIRKRWKSWTH